MSQLPANRRTSARSRTGQRPSSRRTARDEQGTRQRLLEVAGRVFAEKGADRATGKEICQLAGANSAAINYHFDSLDGLYAAVLCEAHRRLATIESIEAAAADAHSARAKLEAVIRLFVTSLTGPVSSSWVIRVLAREIATPTGALATLREREVIPKFKVVRGIIAELMKLPENHPAVSRGIVSVMAPCFMLLVVERRTFNQVFPAFGLSQSDADAIIDHLVRFAEAGLTAVAATARRGR